MGNWCSLCTDPAGISCLWYYTIAQHKLVPRTYASPIIIFLKCLWWKQSHLKSIEITCKICDVFVWRGDGWVQPLTDLHKGVEVELVGVSFPVHLLQDALVVIISAKCMNKYNIFVINTICGKRKIFSRHFCGIQFSRHILEIS